MEIKELRKLARVFIDRRFVLWKLGGDVSITFGHLEAMLINFGKDVLDYQSERAGALKRKGEGRCRDQSANLVRGRG
jgi:hypothetical protein